jgi:hypothetical protein
MYLNFVEAIATLGPDAAFRIANAARPTANYLFATILPEMAKETYHIDSGTMTIRTTMAGLVGMDSPYPPGGAVEVSTFMEQSAKIAIDATLHEATLRELQQMMMRLALSGANTNEALAQQALNFLEKVVVQASLDTAEWLRGQALVTGGIDWTFNKKHLLVNYGIPTAHILTHRTGNDAYGGSASKFWTDWRAGQRALRYNVRAAIANSATVDAIVDNPVNAVEIVSQNENTLTVRRYNTIGGNTVPSTDARDRMTIITYDEEGEILDPLNPGQTILVPFMTAGKLLFVGNNPRANRGFRVGEGSTDDPVNEVALGYYHLAPTVEGGGKPGRWSRLFTPQNEPWQLKGQGVGNELPVIENADLIAVASTALS